jgi:hypothetical protein
MPEDENVDDWFDTLVRDKEAADAPSANADDQALDNLLDSLRKAPTDGAAPLSAYLPAADLEDNETAETVDQATPAVQVEQQLFGSVDQATAAQAQGIVVVIRFPVSSCSCNPLLVVGLIS